MNNYVEMQNAYFELLCNAAHIDWHMQIILSDPEAYNAFDILPGL